jgi:hypothetical protein
MRLMTRRALWAPVALATASVMLAACSSSSSSSSSAGSGAASSPATGGAAGGASSPAAGGSAKAGLKVFVIPKNLGNPYFTLADSVKTSGALAALQTLGETGS